MESKKDEKIGEALLKVALGYQIAEVTEEYAEVDGALKLTKRKKTKKDVPPDLKAVQMLLEKHGGDAEYSDWSDEDLEREKARLLSVLEKGVQTKKAGDGCETNVILDAENTGDGVGDVAGATTRSSTPKKSVRKRSVIKKTVVKKSVATKTTAKKKTTK